MIVALFLLLPAIISGDVNPKSGVYRSTRQLGENQQDSEICTRARECANLIKNLPTADFPFASCSQETKDTFAQIKACAMEIANGDLKTEGAGCAEGSRDFLTLPSFYGKMMKRAIKDLDNVLCKGCSWMLAWQNCTQVASFEYMSTEQCDILRQLEIYNNVVNCVTRAMFDDETCKPLKKDLFDLFHVVRVMYVVGAGASCFERSKGSKALEKRSTPQAFEAYEHLLTMFK